MFVFDTTLTTYQDVDHAGNVIINEIPRIRTCKNIRDINQDYFIANDIGFTIETGETNYQIEDFGPIQLVTQDFMPLITNGSIILFQTQDGEFLVDQNNPDLMLRAQQGDLTDTFFLIAQQDVLLYVTPAVDLSISTDGGASFGNEWRYVLNPIGQRKNRLMWWQGGIANDLVCSFKFWNMGRVVCYDGVVNIRM